MPLNTGPVTKESTGLAVYNAANAAIEEISDSRSRAAVAEMCRRFLDYDQVWCTPTRFIGKDTDTEHEKRVAELAISLEFCARMKNTLSSLGLFDFKQPVAKAPEALAEQVKTMREHADHRDALIYQIFGAGPCSYDHMALPADLRVQVQKILEKKGLLQR